MEPTIQGLSEEEAEARRERGLGNEVRFRTTRTYLQILRHNAFTFINIVLFSIGIILILMGKFGDALVTAGLVLLNVVVGVYQEGRAKRKLEQIALLTRPKATVLRNGQERALDPSEIVLGDVLVARPGDQIVVDGQVSGEGRMEVDESLLSGESERIPKQNGDAVYSGSFCVTGSAFYVAQKVGADNYINQLTAGVRAYRQTKTPLQKDIDWIIRVMVLVVTPVGILLGISFAIQQLPPVEWVLIAAVLVALVPQGLFFMTTVAYAMGVVRVAGRGALIQQINAVESISHVNLLCLDKTGTLTTNRIQLQAMQPLGEFSTGDHSELKKILGDFAASTPGGNRTTEAILEAFGGQPISAEEVVPFSSEWKWSALRWQTPERQGAYILGAPEVLLTRAGASHDLENQIKVLTEQGLRVLLFAHHAGQITQKDDNSEPSLPVDLQPLALLSLREELQPQAQETIEHFSELGIELKLISGDNPDTVAALSRQVGFASDLRCVSGFDLEGKNDAELKSIGEETAIFGRISPQQKEKLVQLFRDKGRYIAMIGDGINDILALKKADVGVAMQSGSQATRGVADIVLLDDAFAALPVAFREGQRIVKGMEDVVRLLLTRTIYVLLLVITTQLMGVAFPVTPKHNSILALLTVGIPILALAAWARPGAPPKSVMGSTSHFVMPAAVTISVVALAVYVFYLGISGSVEVARTGLTTITVLCGLLLIPFVEPPTAWWVGGDEFSGDWRPTLLAAGMLGAYALVMALPVLRSFFELVPLGGWDYLLLGAVAAVWALLQRWIWRARLFERLVQR
jgi:cation-transporting ATPase E